MAKNKNGLTKQQQAFCDDYRSDPEMNATQAYLENYKVKSEKVAAVCASKLLTNAKVQSYLETKRDLAEKKADYDQDIWIKEMLEMKEIFMGRKTYTERTSAFVNGKLIASDEVKRVMNANAALKAMELVAKFFGWVDKKQTINEFTNSSKTHNNWIIMPVQSLHPDFKSALDGKTLND